MAKRSPLSKAETEVARIVWSRGEATVRQVHESLPADRQVDYKTVQTYLRRLEQKGYLQTRREGRTTVFRARVRPGQVIRETVREFVDRLFDGDALPLVEHLIDERPLTTDEIQRLREIVDRLEENSDDRAK